MSNSSLPLVLVQGATGLTGQPLVQKLSDSGKVRIRATTRDPTSAVSKKLAALPNVEIYKCDFNDADSVDQSFKGVDRAFLLNKWGLGDLTTVRENYLAAARNHPECQFLLRYSGIGASVNSPQSSSRDHGFQEEAVKASGIPYTIVRPGAFAEAVSIHIVPIPADRTIRSIFSTGELAPLGMDDITSFCSTILLNPTPHIGQTYTITGGQRVTLPDICTIVSVITGNPVFFRKIDVPAYEKELLKKPWCPPQVLPFVVELVQYLDSGAMSIMTTEDFEKIMGRKPLTMEEWCRANKQIWG